MCVLDESIRDRSRVHSRARFDVAERLTGKQTSADLYRKGQIHLSQTDCRFENSPYIMSEDCILKMLNVFSVHITGVILLIFIVKLYRYTLREFVPDRKIVHFMTLFVKTANT